LALEARSDNTGKAEEELLLDCLMDELSRLEAQVRTNERLKPAEVTIQSTRLIALSDWKQWEEDDNNDNENTDGYGAGGGGGRGRVVHLTVKYKYIAVN